MKTDAEKIISNDKMNFRERFEAWHKAKYGYVNPPPVGYTAFNCVYKERLQQARWEAWQACDNAYAVERSNYVSVLDK